MPLTRTVAEQAARSRALAARLDARIDTAVRLLGTSAAHVARPSQTALEDLDRTVLPTLSGAIRAEYHAATAALRTALAAWTDANAVLHAVAGGQTAPTV